MDQSRHVPPSRRRYEATHPVISAHIPKELQLRIQELKDVSGKSVADILKEALGAQEVSSKEAYDKGFTAGWKKAEKRFRIDHPCSKCGGMMSAVSQGERLAIIGFMRRYRWSHVDCSEDTS